MKKEQEEQDLGNAYQNLHSEENYSEENEETLYEECSSPMEISDNEEIPIEKILTTLHNDETLMETLSSFQDEDEEINDDYYYESDDLNYYDSQSELEFDTSDDKEGEF
jgi:hypothetical protein